MRNRQRISNKSFKKWKGANLQDARLWKADLQKASLGKVDLRGANFEEADLRKATGLKVEQLAEVITQYKAKLNQELLEQIREKYPHLL
jgi:uncharacterized protein YjbI with pentapeptide repeats